MGVDELTKIIKESTTKAEVLNKLDKTPSGGNYRWLNKKILIYKINIDHFKGKAWAKGKTKNTSKAIARVAKSNKIPDVEVFKKNSTYQSSRLRHRLLDLGWKYRCSICGISEWLDNHITLHVDHINGVCNDNRLENLRFLCPNCHQQTDNWGYRGKLSAYEEIRKVERRKFRETLTHNGDGNPEPSPLGEGAETLHGEPKSCPECGKEFYDKKKYCSISCHNEARRSKIPKVPEILKAFEEHKSFLQVGKHFGVSDNAVRKWCNTMGLMDMVKRKSRPQT